MTRAFTQFQTNIPRSSERLNLRRSFPRDFDDRKIFTRWPGKIHRENFLITPRVLSKARAHPNNSTNERDCELASTSTPVQQQFQNSNAFDTRKLTRPTRLANHVGHLDQLEIHRRLHRSDRRIGGRSRNRARRPTAGHRQSKNANLSQHVQRYVELFPQHLPKRRIRTRLVRRNGTGDHRERCGELHLIRVLRYVPESDRGRYAYARRRATGSSVERVRRMFSVLLLLVLVMPNGADQSEVAVCSRSGFGLRCAE